MASGGSGRGAMNGAHVLVRMLTADRDGSMPFSVCELPHTGEHWPGWLSIESDRVFNIWPKFPTASQFAESRMRPPSFPWFYDTSNKSIYF